MASTSVTTQKLAFDHAVLSSTKAHGGTLMSRSPIASELSVKHFLAILKKSERLFLRRVGGLIAEKFEELQKRQKSFPAGIPLLKTEITLFVAAYDAALAETTGEFAGELAQALGQRQGLAKQQQMLVKTQFRKFFRRMTSAKIANALFREFSLSFTLENEEQPKRELVSQITRTRSRSRALRSANEALEYAVALYSARRAEEPRGAALIPSPGEQVADPVRYPSMPVADVQQLFRKSRSSIYRYLDDGKLKRAAMGEMPGKRRPCLILTTSVKKLLEESSE